MMSDLTVIHDENPTTSEQPSGHLRWIEPVQMDPVLQQLWYITTYRGLDVEQVEEWRDVPFVSEP